MCTLPVLCCGGSKPRESCEEGALPTPTSAHHARTCDSTSLSPFQQLHRILHLALQGLEGAGQDRVGPRLRLPVFDCGRHVAPMNVTLGSRQGVDALLAALLLSGLPGCAHGVAWFKFSLPPGRSLDRNRAAAAAAHDRSCFLRWRCPQMDKLRHCCRSVPGTQSAWEPRPRKRMRRGTDVV